MNSGQYFALLRDILYFKERCKPKDDLFFCRILWYVIIEVQKTPQTNQETFWACRTIYRQEALFRNLSVGSVHSFFPYSSECRDYLKISIYLYSFLHPTITHLVIVLVLSCGGDGVFKWWKKGWDRSQERNLSIISKWYFSKSEIAWTEMQHYLTFGQKFQ